MRRRIVILAALVLSACQASTESVLSVEVLAVPASDAAETVDFSKLPEDFPLIAEMKLSSTPKRCGLSKINRAEGAASQDFAGRYVFTHKGEEDGVPLYQVGISGVLRTFKASNATDMATKKVRYFKTIDAPEVEIQVVLEAEGSTQKSTLGRIKAWDSGIPLMCAYNRIEVTGDCDL